MKLSFVIPLVIFVGMYVLFFVGMFAQSPALALPYLCLAPVVGIIVGRASIAAGVSLAVRRKG